MPRFHVHRSTQIHASPQQVFEAIADFGTWTAWSPWLCADPQAHVDVSRDAASVGSVYSWKGDIVGEGEIEHQRLEPGRSIEDEIRFRKPFRSRSLVAFELEPAGEGATVTWHMHGSLPWFMFWMRPQMERFIGMDYERGLKMLKEWIETDQILSKTSVRGVESVGPLRMAGVRKTCGMSEIGLAMEAVFAEAAQKLGAHGVPTDGEAMSVYHEMDLKKQTFEFTSGIVVPESAGPLPAELASVFIPATKALAVEHIGSYDNLGNAWSAAYQFIRYKKLRPGKAPPFEIYRNDLTKTAPGDLRTEIFVPLK